ncbi:hypothetical protein FKW77_004354 [Venturia effusa]|uniref:Uncharacterized protein n=1 Tax=Venturia effusa TaxID=50376 RepID=A0A517L158_9PEZI|nr:hypothetical protein FKW77_004354 [Venturia effusa]
MKHRTPTRNRGKSRPASPPAIRTPRSSIRSEKIRGGERWAEQERGQQRDFGMGCDSSPLNSPRDEAERRPNVDDHVHPQNPPSEKTCKNNSKGEATSSELDHNCTEISSSVDQKNTTGNPESTIAVFEEDESQSEYASEQENQPPIEVPATPPHEPTYHRLQRQPLKQLTIDRNGNLLLTPSSLAEYSPSYTFATSAQIDEDEGLESDSESDASTIMLSPTRKRGASELENYGDGKDENHIVTSRPSKRLKASGSARNDRDQDRQYKAPTPAKMGAAGAVTYTTPSAAEGIVGDSDSESIASTIMPSPRKRSSRHLVESTGSGDTAWSSRTNMRKRQRASTAGEFFSRGRELGEAKPQQGRKHLVIGRNQSGDRRNLLMPANGGVQSKLSRARGSPSSLLKSKSVNREIGTPLPVHRVWLPTPAKTPITDSTQQPHPVPEIDSVDGILTRLEAAEARFTHWLKEVRNEKGRYRRLLAQQKEDQQVIQEDMARIRQLEAIIQTMATEELDDIEEDIEAKEEDVSKLAAQRKEIRQRLLGFEKLRHDFEGERLRTR